MFFKWTALCLAIVFCLACDPIESGTPPTFQGNAQAKVLGEQQATVSWNPGSDDLLDPDELRYGIWFDKATDGLNLEQSAQIVTSAGAISYSLVGLEADTEYEVLVRARDLGAQYSDNTQTITFTTSVEGGGRLAPPVDIDFTYQVSGLLSGPIFSEIRDDIGLIEGRRIHWHASGGEGISATETEVTDVGEAIVEAHLVRTDIRFFRDLFVVTATGLSYYRNTGNGFNQTTWSTNLVPEAGSLQFFLEEGVLVAFSFLESGTTGRIFSNDAQAQEVDDTFVDRGTPTVPNSSGRFFLAKVDEDDFVDMVSFGPNGLRLSLGSNEDYEFDSATDIDTSITFSADDHSFLFADGDGDGNEDVYIYERDDRAAVSKLNIFKNQGDGTFADVQTTDYDGATFDTPRFSNVNGDNRLDLTFLHSAANNIAVALGPSANFNQISDYFGTDAVVIYSAWGQYNNIAGQDLVLVTNNKITVLTANATGLP